MCTTLPIDCRLNVEDVAGTSVQRYLDRTYAVFVLNGVKVEAFKDQRVREAIDLAVDRQAMIDKLHFGDAELAGPVGPLWDSALPAEEVEAAYRRDVQKARQLLSAAGAALLSGLSPDVSSSISCIALNNPFRNEDSPDSFFELDCSLTRFKLSSSTCSWASRSTAKQGTIINSAKINGIVSNSLFILILFSMKNH